MKKFFTLALAFTSLVVCAQEYSQTPQYSQQPQQQPEYSQQPAQQPQQQQSQQANNQKKPLSIKFQANLEISGMVGNSNILGTQNTIGGPTLDLTIGALVDRFFVGVGVGGYAYIGKFKEEKVSIVDKVEGYRYAVNLPIYGNCRIYATTGRQVNTFVDVAVGGTVGLWQSQDVKDVRTYKGMSGQEKPAGAFFLRSGVGLEFGHVIVGAGYQLLAESGSYQNFGYIKLGSKF